MELHEEIVRRDVPLAVDRETAWPALADPARLEEWFARDVDVDIEPGAEGTVTDHDGAVRDVVVEEVVPERRVALRWRTGDEPETIVELTLEDDGAGACRLVVVEVSAALVRAVSTRLVAAGGAHGPALVAA
ncbi:SRPBCC domain-containing protein [Paraconexibacter antarcticus]|uniref:SRPBCC domain-containing protein n=1 Tax=Paraconexibacter antarcticus TaxID=2949664 RepID=A0ABY5E192_9ACTN|nr:SRPBCC domain-containing protein [Paraconexibacter antarcticus]UTI66585.1 SRPBCC domain-containing protein [Paraconexibacter antarcticus]